MRVLLAALICFVIASASYSSTVEMIIFGTSGLPDYSLILILLSTYLMLEGIYLIEHERQISLESSQAAARGVLRSNENTSEKPNNEQEQEIEKLHAALRDAERKLKEASQTEKHGSRDALVNAEIIHLLGLLQDKGRFIDFLMDDVTPYEDAQVGAAARVVHQGCLEVMKEYFEIEPIYSGAEGSTTELKEGYPSEEFRLLGSQDSPPFSGKVVHRGWKSNAVSLPRVTSDTEAQAPHSLVIAPAQVQL